MGCGGGCGCSGCGGSDRGPATRRASSAHRAPAGRNVCGAGCGCSESGDASSLRGPAGRRDASGQPRHLAAAISSAGLALPSRGHGASPLSKGNRVAQEGLTRANYRHPTSSVVSPAWSRPLHLPMAAPFEGGQRLSGGVRLPHSNVDGCAPLDDKPCDPPLYTRTFDGGREYCCPVWSAGGIAAIIDLILRLGGGGDNEQNDKPKTKQNPKPTNPADLAVHNRLLFCPQGGFPFWDEDGTLLGCSDAELPCPEPFERRVGLCVSPDNLRCPLGFWSTPGGGCQLTCPNGSAATPEGTCMKPPEPCKQGFEPQYSPDLRSVFCYPEPSTRARTNAANDPSGIRSMAPDPCGRLFSDKVKCWEDYTREIQSGVTLLTKVFGAPYCRTVAGRYKGSQYNQTITECLDGIRSGKEPYWSGLLAHNGGRTFTDPKTREKVSLVNDCLGFLDCSIKGWGRVTEDKCVLQDLAYNRCQRHGA